MDRKNRQAIKQAIQPANGSLNPNTNISAIIYPTKGDSFTNGLSSRNQRAAVRQTVKYFESSEEEEEEDEEEDNEVDGEQKKEEGNEKSESDSVVEEEESEESEEEEKPVSRKGATRNTKKPAPLAKKPVQKQK